MITIWTITAVIAIMSAGMFVNAEYNKADSWFGEYPNVVLYCLMVIVVVIGTGAVKLSLGEQTGKELIPFHKEQIDR